MSESVKCPHCGTINPAQAEKCRLCGMMISDEEASVGGVCISCGAKHPKGTEICNSCGMPVRELVKSNQPVYGPEGECVHWSDTAASTAWKTKIYVAGVLVLLAGVMGVTQAVLSLIPEIGEDILQGIADALPGSEDVNDLLAEFVVLQIMILIFGAIAIFGSIYALTIRRFDVALIGSIFGILAIGLIIGAFFSLIGMLLLVSSRKEFNAACS